MLLDAESGYRFAGSGDAVDNFLGPTILDTDYHNRGNVGIGAGADQCTEMQFEVFPELKPAIGMGYRHGIGNIVGNRFTGCIRQVIDRQDDNVVANADPAVFAPVS
jgi:hypothetical protein